MFPNQQLALQATTRLAQAGFRTDQVRVVSAGTTDRHDFIDRRTSDSKRGMLLGITYGAVAGVVFGVAISGVFGLLPSVAVGVLIGVGGGAVLGQTVGRVTRNEVQTQIEEQVESGAVLVSVTTDGEHSDSVVALFSAEGGQSIVATAASFTVEDAPSPSGHATSHVN